MTTIFWTSVFMPTEQRERGERFSDDEAANSVLGGCGRFSDLLVFFHHDAPLVSLKCIALFDDLLPVFLFRIRQSPHVMRLVACPEGEWARWRRKTAGPCAWRRPLQTLARVSFYPLRQKTELLAAPGPRVGKSSWRVDLTLSYFRFAR